ncbi:MAG TPA: response regulator [Pirellulales bacterium]|nr:response regulator [Pirellulales bacterium]
MSLSVTVSIVDDDQQVRESLAALLGSAKLDVSCYASGSDFLEHFLQSRPGCVVLDLRLPQQSGLEILDELAARRNKVPVIMISGHGDITTAVTAMKAGAVDFFEKPYRGSDLLESVRRAIDMDVRRRRAQHEYDRLRARFNSLTDQEHEVLRLTMAGKPDKAIAIKLDLSLRTIQMRRSSVMRKLDARSRTELILLTQSLESLTR